MFFYRRVKLVSETRQGIYRLFELYLSRIKLPAEGKAALFELFELICAREYTCAAGGAAAGHRAAGVYELTVKADDAQTVAVCL